MPWKKKKSRSRQSKCHVFVKQVRLSKCHVFVKQVRLSKCHVFVKQVRLSKCHVFVKQARFSYGESQRTPPLEGTSLHRRNISVERPWGILSLFTTCLPLWVKSSRRSRCHVSPTQELIACILRRQINPRYGVLERTEPERKKEFYFILKLALRTSEINRIVKERKA